LVKLNCAAIPENVVESELFGHEKGAFTGANTQRKGCFERAHGGTLFLDEIGEMAPELQAKMLRVLQDSCVTRVGGADVQHVDVRVVSATHRDLELEMEEGRFREDLFYRLNVVEIHVPSLRDRKADIPPLAMAFAEKVSKKGVRFAPAFEKSLCQYDWPGNVRELQNAMERAVLLARGGLFMPEHLPRRLLKSLSEQPPQQADPQATLSDFAKTIPSDNPHEPVQHQEDHPPTNLEGREEEHILNILNACSGNRSEAARELGVSRRTLLYRIKKMEAKGFEIPGPRGRRNTSES
jgi:two-component system response regulator HydG